MCDSRFASLPMAIPPAGEWWRAIWTSRDKVRAKVVLIGSITPLVLKTPENPVGTLIKALDGYQTGCSTHPLIRAIIAKIADANHLQSGSGAS
jgi:hypothetical protein